MNNHSTCMCATRSKKRSLFTTSCEVVYVIRKCGFVSPHNTFWIIVTCSPFDGHAGFVLYCFKNERVENEPFNYKKDYTKMLLMQMISKPTKLHRMTFSCLPPNPIALANIWSEIKVKNPDVIANNDAIKEIVNGSSMSTLPLNM